MVDWARLRPRRSAGWTVAAGAGLVVGSWAVGLWLSRHGVNLHLGTTWPVKGHFQPRLSGWLAVPLAFGALAWWYGPRLAAVLPWRWLPLVAAGGTAAWAVSLALVDGPAGILGALPAGTEYPNDVGKVDDLSTYLATFTDRILGPHPWTTHVAGHPPGALGVFVLLDHAGLSSLWWAAGVCVAGGALATAAVLGTVRILAGPQIARRAAPFLVLAPTALWVATSADAMFAGVAAGGLYLLARGTGWALAGGVLLGACLFLSYGLALLVVLAVTVVVAQRRCWPLVVGAAGAAAVVAAVCWAGFWWLDGLALTTERVHRGEAWRDRPYGYFLFADLAAVVVMLGPAVLAAAARIRRAERGVVVLAAAAAATVAVAAVTGLAKGEVERIFLPFAIWLLPLAALLSGRTARRWLTVQAGYTFVLNALLGLAW